MPVTFKIDAKEFNSTLKKYLRRTSRDFATAVNTKAFYIARRATLTTHKADKDEIASLLKRTASVIVNDRLKHGPRGALIINKWRGKQGLPGLYGDAMREEFERMLKGRRSAVAFLRSGWIPAIKHFEPLADKGKKPNADNTAKQHGKSKGGGMAATPGTVTAATIWNAAGTEQAKHHSINIGQALERFGTPGLQAAFDFEMGSMLKYLEDKMRESAKKEGIQTN